MLICEMFLLLLTCPLFASAVPSSKPVAIVRASSKNASSTHVGLPGSHALHDDGGYYSRSFGAYGSALPTYAHALYNLNKEADLNANFPDYSGHGYRELPYDYYTPPIQPYEENVYADRRTHPKSARRRKYYITVPRGSEYEEDDYGNFAAPQPPRGAMSSNYGYSYAGYIERQARMYPIMMYTLIQCTPCQRAKHVLATAYRDVRSHFLELVGDEEWQRQLQVDLQHITGALTFPYIFICGTYIGGASDLLQLHHNGQLRQMVNACSRLPV